MEEDLLNKIFVSRSEDCRTACGKCQTERYTLAVLYANTRTESHKAFFNNQQGNCLFTIEEHAYY